jgi:hypothetical protein
LGTPMVTEVRRCRLIVDHFFAFFARTAVGAVRPAG